MDKIKITAEQYIKINEALFQASSEHINNCDTDVDRNMFEFGRELGCAAGLREAWDILTEYIELV